MIRERDETEDRSHAIFDHLAIGVVHSTAAGILLNINSKFCELSGYARAEALALDVGRLMHPEDWAKSMAAS
jgi:PAS domain S-box-containing protein